MRFLQLFIFILAFVWAPSAFADEPMLDIQEIQSESGITAWLVEDHSVPVIAMQFGFKGAGSIQDADNKQGLARLVSNTMDEGAGSLNAQAFQKELQDLVISLSFSSSRDHFTGSLKTLTKNKARAFELTKLALTKPRFDQEALDRMRKANQSRIRSSLSDPGWMAARILNDKAFDGHPYAMNSGGTLSSLDGIKTSDLEAFHEEYIGMNNLVVSVAGDITAEELRTVLNDVFGDLPDVEIPDNKTIDVQNQGQIFHYAQDIPQTVIEIMQPGIGRDDPKFHMAQIMNFILGSSGFGSRLTEEIREKRGLTYGIYSYFYDLEYLKGLAVSTSTTADNVPEMMEQIGVQFNAMAAEPVSDSELSDAKSYLVGSLPLSLTSTDKIAGLMNSLQLDALPIDYLDIREAAIEATTKEDIQNLAKDLLAPSSFVTVLVGQSPNFGEAGPEIIAVKSLPNVE